MKQKKNYNLLSLTRKSKKLIIKTGQIIKNDEIDQSIKLNIDEFDMYGYTQIQFMIASGSVNWQVVVITNVCMYVCMYGKFIFNGQLNFCFQISQIEKMIIIRLDSKENHHHHCNHINKKKLDFYFPILCCVSFFCFALL